MQAHQRVLAEVKVLGAQVGGLLGAGAGVVEEQDQGAVPQCERAVAGQVAQEVFDLVLFEEPGFWRGGALDRDGGHLLAGGEHFRFPSGDVVEQAVQGGQPLERPVYNFDTCPSEVVLNRMSVKAGRLVLPDGMSYRLLVLPQVETMTPQLLRKIAGLVKAGATVVGARPLKSPSLSDYPKCNQQVAKPNELWGADDTPAELTARPYGKGRVIHGRELEKNRDPTPAASRGPSGRDGSTR